MFFGMFACMLCSIWGCDALALRRQEALVAPSWARSCLTIEECCRGRTHTHTHTASAFLSDAPHATREVCNICSTNTCEHFGAHAQKSLRVWAERMQIQRQHLCRLYTLLWHAGFLEAPGLSEGPGVLRLSFVKEPQGPCRGWLEHTWQFEPLGRSAGITPNWLWRLAVSPRLKMVCCCALCIGRGFGSHRGRKGFFRNQWGGW